MDKMVCPSCKRVHESDGDKPKCPTCGATEGEKGAYNFRNSDDVLRKAVERVAMDRKKRKLDGLVGGLQAVIINTEPDAQVAAISELLATTGLDIVDGFEDDFSRTAVLRVRGSADVLVTSRKVSDNPFAAMNRFPRTEARPNTRLETFVFETSDIERYVKAQMARGVKFLTKDIIRTEHYAFIQTPPSQYTANSLGFVEWLGTNGGGGRRQWAPSYDHPLDWGIEKPAKDHLAYIKELDHAATRVRAQDRDAAIIELMELTNYDFEFAIYVDTLNSITNVARLKGDTFAMVVTSGISPFSEERASGPTEKFIRNYGPRVHHLAFNTEDIEDVYERLGRDGTRYLIRLVGSPKEGLKQTFTEPSENTFLVNEYIHRYGDFDGFFTKSNVTLLTQATDWQ